MAVSCHRRPKDQMLTDAVVCEAMFAESLCDEPMWGLASQVALAWLELQLHVLWACSVNGVNGVLSPFVM